MADVRLTVEKSSPQGLNASQTSVNSSDTYLINNNGAVITRVVNNDSSSETVTIQTPDNLGDGLTISDPTVSIPASEARYIGAFGPGLYNYGQDVKLTFSNGTSTVIEVVKI